jgi:mannosyl-glycoprotein endo-beta-N-acetylglucosaminidase
VAGPKSLSGADLPESPPLIPNGPYFQDPNWPADLDRYTARIDELLGPAIARLARAQARLEVGDGQFFSTPYNFGNVGNTDSNPKAGGGFRNPEAAAEAWVAFITNDGGPTRYQAFQDAGAAGADVPTLARLIAEAGYATGPNYAQEVAALA